MAPWGPGGPNDPSTPTQAAGPGPGPSSQAPLSAAETRARVEAAKQVYKREKEMYRRAREERKAAEQRQAAAGETSTQDGAMKAEDNVLNTPAPISHIVSNARGPYPELEMIPVSRNNRRNVGPTADEGHHMRRITRRLADMGFTENAYPTLPSRIKDLLDVNRPLSKEGEDDIVTSLLEELLETAAQPAPASSSTPREDRNIPGAWH